MDQFIPARKYVQTHLHASLDHDRVNVRITKMVKISFLLIKL